MTTPNNGPFKNVFDMSINLPTILSGVVLVVSAVWTLSKLETRADHDADIRGIQVEYMRKDLSALSDRDYREWMQRIEEKLDRIQRENVAKDR